MIAFKNRTISTGYVGSPPGEPHCLDDGCLINPYTGGCVRTRHAEENAIIFLHENKVVYDPSLSVLYTTLAPCINCSGLIVKEGIPKVVYLFEYRKTDGIDFLKSKGVVVERYKGRLI